MTDQIVIECHFTVDGRGRVSSLVVTYMKASENKPSNHQCFNSMWYFHHAATWFYSYPGANRDCISIAKI